MRENNICLSLLPLPWWFSKSFAKTFGGTQHLSRDTQQEALANFDPSFVLLPGQEMKSEPGTANRLLKRSLATLTTQSLASFGALLHWVSSIVTVPFAVFTSSPWQRFDLYKQKLCCCGWSVKRINTQWMNTKNIRYGFTLSNLHCSTVLKH